MSRKGKATDLPANVVPAAELATITAYKGFNADLTCRDFQFEIGKTYEHLGDVVACKAGFHACEHPLNVLFYYPPATSRYAEVTLSGAMSRHDDDTKIAATKITVNVELSIGELTKRAIEWVFARAKCADGSTVTLPSEAATASGDQGAAMASGCRGAATASGYQGAAMASGCRGAAMASGDQGAAMASGDQGAAMADHPTAVAHATGRSGKARGLAGSALHLNRRDDDGNITHVWAGIVGRGNLKPMIWYTLDKNGHPVECE